MYKWIARVDLNISEVGTVTCGVKGHLLWDRVTCITIDFSAFQTVLVLGYVYVYDSRFFSLSLVCSVCGLWLWACLVLVSPREGECSIQFRFRFDMSGIGSPGGYR